MENNSQNEMFLISKYKYINKIAKSVAQVASVNLTTTINKNIPNGAENGTAMLSKEEEKDIKKSEAQLAAKLKEEKKKKMADMCKPGAKNENKTKFVEKEKYVDETPIGEKKGIYVKLIFNLF
jgi:protein subunit release factor A